jgi:long-chain acyl-CoA synthetase
MIWPRVPASALREERHFDDRVFPCYAARPSSVHALFAAMVARHPKNECVVAGATRWSYRALDEAASRVAGGLAARGIGKGDRVALLLGNTAEFPLFLLACARMGAIAVPLSVRLKAPELDYALNDCGAVALVLEAALAETLPTRDRLPLLRHLLVAGRDIVDAAPLAPVPVGEEEVAVILYTSGTTGRPKGAMLTHLGIVHSAMNFANCVELGPPDRAVLAVPASHVTGLAGVFFSTLSVGGCTVFMRQFKTREFLALASAERLTYTVMVPAQYAFCLMDPELAGFDLSSWRIGCFGGAPMPEATIAALAARLPDLVLVNGYGATETTSPSVIMPLGENVSRPDSIGQAVPCCTVRVVGEDGEDVPPGAPGELWIKGPHVVPGYWNRPDANAAEFTDGFWHSGDIGSRDADGYLRVFDRKKDMINRAGFKIYSAEVENTLALHPGVAESAVIGVPDPVLGERVKAVVFPRDPVPTAEELRAFCAERLADYKVPEVFEFAREPLPRNVNGKLQKALLRGAAQKEGP